MISKEKSSLIGEAEYDPIEVQNQQDVPKICYN